jgi:hypothetical protein
MTRLKKLNFSLKVNIFCVALFFVAISSLKSDIIPSGGLDGNFWQPGSTQFISWSKYFMDTTKTLDIYLWNGDIAEFSLIASNIAVAEGYYLWDIPQDHPTGDLFKVKVVYHNGYFPEFKMVSNDFFPILPPQNNALHKQISVYVLNKNSSIKVFPNPSSSIINIESSDKFFNVELYQMDGTLLHSENFEFKSQYTFDASNLPSGSYSLRVKFLGSNVTEQIVINK